MAPIALTEVDVQILDNLSPLENLWPGDAKTARLLEKLQSAGFVKYKQQPYITEAGLQALAECDGGVPDGDQQG